MYFTFTVTKVGQTTDDIALRIAREEPALFPDRATKHFVTGGCIGPQLDMAAHTDLVYTAHVTPKHPTPIFTLWRCDHHTDTLSLTRIRDFREGDEGQLAISEAFDYRLECTCPGEISQFNE